MRNRKPAYITLYEKIRNDIVNGTYPYQSKLPGKRVLADHTGLSLATAEHALSLLEEEGFIEAKQRSGFYVAYHGSGQAVQEEEESFSNTDILSSSLDSEALPSSVTARALRRLVSEHQEDILKKTEKKGLPSLRSAIARYLARSRGMQVKSDQIIIGSGAEYLYSLIVQMLGRDKIYGVENPCYEKIMQIYKANGAAVDPLTMGKHGILTKELERTKASVLHITPYHSYPSGVTADAAKRHQYIEWSLKHNAVIIEDDYDSEFTVSSKPEDTLFSLAPDRVIYMNTFTRTISPGLRVSYMILPQKMLDLFNEKAGFYANTVSTLVQMLTAELINSGEFERHINRVRRKRRKETGN